MKATIPVLCLAILLLCISLVKADPTFEVAGQLPFHGPKQITSLTQGSNGNFCGITNDFATNYGGTFFQMTSSGSVTTLHVFADATVSGTANSQPNPGLVEYNGLFYGTSYGSSGVLGTIFTINSSGSDSVLTPLPYPLPGAYGSLPVAGLYSDGAGNFYGTNPSGGTHTNVGTVFKVTASGSLYSLHDFAGGATEGDTPMAGLILGTDGALYGTTMTGGTNDAGTIFKITTSGSFTTLYQFNATSDGANPISSLTWGGDGYFYGTTSAGGTSTGSCGTLFKVAFSGTNSTFVKLHDFIGTDGGSSSAGLILGPDGNFYGTTGTGGANGVGVIFKISSSGSGSFSVLHSFTYATEGGYPQSNLIQANDGKIYGTTDTVAFRLVFSGSSTPIQTWRQTNFGASASNPAVSGDTVVNNKAGITNLMAYALGLNPYTATVSGLPTSGMATVSGTNYLKLSFSRTLSATDITYTVQGSPDLSGTNWSTVSTYSGGAWSPSGNVTDSSGAVIVRDTVAIGSTARRFLRLTVTH